MRKYFDTCGDTSTGRPVLNAQVSLFQRDGITSVPIYSDTNGAVIKQPLLTNSRGYFEFYTANGSYKLQTAYPGSSTITIDDVEIYDDSTAIRVPEGELGPTLPARSERAGQILGFDSNGNLAVIAAVPDGSIADSLGNSASIAPSQRAVQGGLDAEQLRASNAEATINTKLTTAQILLQQAIDALATGTVAALIGTRVYASLTALNADLVPAAGLYALVVGDSTAANNDLYVKVGATGSGSWTGPLGIFASASAAAQAAAASILAFQDTMSDYFIQSATITSGKAINQSTGEITTNVNFDLIIYTLTGSERGFRASGLVTSSDQALAVWTRSDETVARADFVGTPPNNVNYQHQVLGAPPSDAVKLYIQSRLTTEPSLELLQLSPDLAIRLHAMEDQLDDYDDVHSTVEGWNTASAAVTENAFINNGTHVPQTGFAGFRFADIVINPGDRVQVAQTLLVGTGTSLANYYSDPSGSAISFLGNQVAGTTAAQAISKFELTIPNNAVLARVAGSNSPDVPIILKKRGVASSIADRVSVLEGAATSATGAWAGLKVTADGDSLIQLASWSPWLVGSTGVSLVNTGVGGSKVAKPDASGTQISMCDDARVNAIPADSFGILVEGAPNDWVQSVPLGTIDSTTDTEFYGAWNIRMQKVLTRCPTARIFLITPHYADQSVRYASLGWADAFHNLLGLTIADYATVIRNIAHKYECPLMDWGWEAGISSLNISTYLLFDGTTGSIGHTTTAGGKRDAEVMVGTFSKIQPIL